MKRNKLPEFTVSELYRKAKKDIPTLSLADLKLILAKILKLEFAGIHSSTTIKLTKYNSQRYQSILDKVSNNIPVAYIVGKTEFYGLEIIVDKGVLIPRPETEQLVELAIKSAKQLSKRPKGHLKILEVGIGTGCITTALAKELQKAKIPFEYFGIDISVKAIRNTAKNLQLHRVEKLVSTEKMSLRKLLKSSNQKGFNLIISNPPYLTASQMTKLPPSVQKEPKRALFGGKDGLTYFKQINQFAYLMKADKGRMPNLVLEADPEIMNSLFLLLSNRYASEDLKIHQDLFKQDRFITAQLL